MAAAGGLKHVPTEPAPLVNKREHRRGASGRAAALRRAPSDSDCSGETASLSADSGERRPLPPKPGKTRSRRRGSEWEVLEGLKDGQRFDRRPEVFNGYLHKKRKWPLKGWHKRFFVVDGGILVYARSPTDVARGRLHGSVDVGLSVISAKARRRRIDIDADEFIYHLRAKTADVFRTWLNVLKVHRLYRQHLLTFGARESTPKAIEDLPQPPTETSSRTESAISLSSASEDSRFVRLHDYSTIPGIPKSLISPADSFPFPKPAEKFSREWRMKNSSNELMPLKFEPLEEIVALNNPSLCSINCVTNKLNKQYEKLKKNECVNSNREQMYSGKLNFPESDSRNIFLGPVINERRKYKDTNIRNILKDETHKGNTYYDNPSPKLYNQSHFLYQCSLNTSPGFGNSRTSRKLSIFKSNSKTTRNMVFKSKSKSKHSLFEEYNKKEQTPPCTITGTTTYEKKHDKLVRRSNKSTNLILYKNILSETKLHEPLSKSLLLRHHQSKQADLDFGQIDDSDECLVQLELQAEKQDKSVQDTMTVAEYDQISKSLMTTVLKNFNDNVNDKEGGMKAYIKGIVKELYDEKDVVRSNIMKLLFKSLLQYWMKNTSLEEINHIVKQDKSIDKPSNNGFTTDQKLSNVIFSNIAKETQHGICYKHLEEFTQSIVNASILEKKNRETMPVKDSIERKQRVKELEKLLKNTMNICETHCSRHINEKERNNRHINKIEITKKRSSDLEHLSDKFMTNTSRHEIENPNSLNEHFKIRETLTYLINETYKIENVGTYLDVLISKRNNYHEEKSTVHVYCADSNKPEHSSINCPINKSTIGIQKNMLPTKAPHKYKVLKNRKQTTDRCKPFFDKGTNVFTKPITRNKINSNKNKPIKSMDVIVQACEQNDTDLSMLQNPALCETMPVSKNETQPHGTSYKYSNSTLNSFRDDYITKSCNPADLKFSRSCTNMVSSLINTTINSKTLSGSDATSKAFGRFLQKRRNSVDTLNSSKNTIINSIVEPNSDATSKNYVGYLEKEKKRFLENFQASLLKHIKFTDTGQQVAFCESLAGEIVDEEFILSLLENVTIISKHVPIFHRDLCALYTKLKNRHEQARNKITHKNPSCEIIDVSKLDFGISTEFKENQSFLKHSASACENVQNYDDSKNTDKLPHHLRVTTQAEPNHKFIGALAKSATISIDKETALTSDKNLSFDVFKTLSSYLDTDTLKDCCVSTENLCFIGRHNHNLDENSPSVTPLTKKRKTIVVNNCMIEQSPYYEALNKQVSSEVKTNKDRIEYMRNTNYKVQLLFMGKALTDTNSSVLWNSVLDFQRSSNNLNTIYRNYSNPSFPSDLISPTSQPIRGPQAGFVSGTPGGRLASWIVESGGPLETASRELGQAQLSVQQLQRLLEQLELHQHHDTDVSLEGASPNVKKDRRKFGLRKKKSSSKCSSVELAPTLHIDGSSSHSTLSTLTAPPSPGGGPSSMPTSATSLPIACSAARPQSLPAEALAPPPLLPPDHLREDFLALAKDVVHTVNSVLDTLICERGRLRAAMEAAEGATSPAVVAALRNNLSTALQQNSVFPPELRSRLTRIHDASDIADVTAAHSDPASRPFHQSLSFSSSCVSASEFFDAEEHEDDMKTAEILAADEAGVIELDGDSSSEAGSLSSHGSEASASSENSDTAMLTAESRPAQNGNSASSWSRRTTLPSPRPTPGGPSLWNLLYKNIGKDLSQISMPVTINEPLNMLQRLCEELEYSELLDSAAQGPSGVERMALIAAFAVSSYAAAAHRAASKPFNPLLAETYECVRDDRSFRFIAEQVSHHPPVSACHADSPAWSFWQEARIKTKFWGKSMEFQPAGRVHVRLNTTGDHYSWNKVTTCVHNLFGGQRWVDQYGEMTIVCHGTQITCKLNFVKASSWSSSRHEVRGAVSDGSTGARLRLQGRWSEALYAGEPPAARCLWRPGAMPPDHEQYYGFTRFAMELNEMEPGMRQLLPPTDTRLRPDQRALESGDVEAAEQHKLQLEQTQRERRRDGLEHQPHWFRKTISDGEEMWVFGGEYWKAREAGYAGHNLPVIW